MDVIRRFGRAVYNYGLWYAFKRALSADRFVRPSRIGLVRFLRHGMWKGRLRKMQAGGAALDIIITFDWGGGAAVYLQERLKRDCLHALVVKNSIVRGWLKGELWDNGVLVGSYWLHGLNVLRGLRKTGVGRIVVNELVGWHMVAGEELFTNRGIEHVIGQIIGLKDFWGCALNYLVHDYFSVCPRWTLVACDDVYCASEVSCGRCRSCLQEDCQEYFYRGGIDVLAWRRSFARLLMAADEVRVFSEDAKRRLRLVYPAINVVVVPHVAIGGELRRPVIRGGAIVIGVFGLRLPIKGAGKVDELEKYLSEIGRSDVRIARIDKYKRDKMPDIVEREGINVAFFSSVCPETFSFVTQELIMMNLPIVCYNLGAPADRIRDYDRGRVIPDMSIPATWQTIESLVSDQRKSAFYA